MTRTVNSSLNPQQHPALPMLQAQDIDFSYGNLQVLFGVSLQVTQGEALALLGTNGAGKSTLLRVISGLEKADGGQHLLDEQDNSEQPAERLARRVVVLIPRGHADVADRPVAVPR